jgi:hypothetical protein
MHFDVHSNASNRFDNRAQWIDFAFPVWIQKARGPGPLQAEFAMPNISYALDWLSDYEKMNALLVAMRGYPMDSDTNFIKYPPNFVLVHNDARLDNCFFDDENNTGRFVDWQATCARHPIMDLAWIFAEMRLELLENSSTVRRLLEHYLHIVQRKFKHIKIRDLLEALPLGITFLVYNVVVVNLALADEDTIRVMQNTLRRCEIIFQLHGVPRLTTKMSVISSYDAESKQDIRQEDSSGAASNRQNRSPSRMNSSGAGSASPVVANDPYSETNNIKNSTASAGSRRSTRSRRVY